MQSQIRHFILPLEPVVKPIYEHCRTFPEEWEIQPDKLVIQVVNNINIYDTANIETVVNLFIAKKQQSLELKGLKPIDSQTLSGICKMLIQLYICLLEMYNRFNFWNTGLYKVLKFHNFVNYDVILTTG